MRHVVQSLLRCSSPALILAAGGCHANHQQSALHTAAGASEEIATLWWAMFAALVVSFFMVMAILWMAVRRSPNGDGEDRERVRRRNRRLVLGGGVLLPTTVLVGMLFASLGTSLALRRDAEGVRIEVTGYQWWWHVHYPETGITLANEIYLPAGEPALIELRAADVVHSFWVPNLHGKIDLLPDMRTRIVIEPDEPGEWRGQCAEFCGRQHAWMAFTVIALPPAEFAAWAQTRQTAPPASIESDLIRHGREVFFAASCHTCHAIQGTRAQARLGPDLTHLGSRRTLGAGRVPNTEANLEQWILDPQSLKPGNLMPATPLSPGDLRALVAYLRSLQ